MLNIQNLLDAAQIFRQIVGLPEESTLSWRMFGDTKRLASLRHGGEITVGRFNNAMTYLATKWPQDHPRPDFLAAYGAVRRSEDAA